MWAGRQKVKRVNEKKTGLRSCKTTRGQGSGRTLEFLENLQRSGRDRPICELPHWGRTEEREQRKKFSEGQRDAKVWE